MTMMRTKSGREKKNRRRRMNKPGRRPRRKKKKTRRRVLHQPKEKARGQPGKRLKQWQLAGPGVRQGQRSRLG